MNIQFQTAITFKNSLKEVENLEELADLFKNNIDEVSYYRALNKTAILLLGSKFEVFLEESVFEFVEKINELRIEKQKIPTYLKVKHSQQILDEVYKIYKHDAKIFKVEQHLKKLSDFWNEKCECIQLNINNKFNYGSHGSNEIIELFKNINIENVFLKVNIVKVRDGMLGEENIKVDFKGELNSFINMRNAITHLDQTANLTHLDVIKYRELFILFSEELIKVFSDIFNEEYMPLESGIVDETIVASEVGEFLSL